MDAKTKNRLLWQVPFLIFLILGTIWILQRNKELTYHNDGGQVFGTTYHITYEAPKNLAKDISKRLEEVNRVFSTFSIESEISRINSNQDTPAKASAMMQEVFVLAQSISVQTDGAFDITVAPLVNAWGFGFENSDSITPYLIDSLRQFVGFRKVSLTDGRVMKSDPRTMIDCSAIAKGYGSDMVAKLLEENGVKNYMVEIGGEIVVKGHNKKGKPWRIGINKPIENTNANELQTMLDITDIAMATSGNYRRFYIKGNQKYAHTIDPTTGYPVQHTLLSATVLAPTCAMADAYATAFMVMGMEKAKSVLNKHPELQAYFIYTDASGANATWATSKISDIVSSQ